jgi:hypothetical protein
VLLRAHVPSSGKVIVLDTDMIMAEPVEKLFSEASNLAQPFVFAPDHGSRTKNVCDLCSGVAVLDLDAIRELGGTKRMFELVPLKERSYRWADQSMYRSLCARQRHLFGLVGEQWNRSLCNRARRQFPSCYAISHFNCHYFWNVSEFDPLVLREFAADVRKVQEWPWRKLCRSRDEDRRVHYR